MKILRIDASAIRERSQSRKLTDQLISELGDNPTVVERDLTQPVPHVDQTWVMANNTPEADRSTEQKETLALSDQLIAELEETETIVIGLPVYNFSVPASLKAWIDQVCRPGRTFAYSESGPVGLLRDKKAVVVYVSGGTPFGSEFDFASGYMRHILSFIGITDVHFVNAECHLMDAGNLEAAAREVNRIATDMAA